MFPTRRGRRGLFDSFFDDFFTENTISLRTDLIEQERDYLFKVDLPGVNKEDIKINLKNNYLTITVEKKEEKEVEESRYLRKERYFGSATRSYYVGNVNTDDLKASYENGVLEVVVPKEGKEETKYIEVK
ncbi:MAG: Hsp20/alpha crystallin family protein [Acholeplasmatales bacterium]|nr:Hsp20/alpha crystallin family protein [Acholeplasmataceae bacterium]MDY0115501.1 Hsp20/alpha crystallin family protein [Acholeplasmatales bacterium]MCK9234271.1 Hsp20/alpha crystallin family protein [Acholeplasmataceae bacterium]MCK9289700.1 Hsp20/alpha crystallin family protein [Acholeplasmataceae bacterium]MCK9427761.1 Hsp20/alpha crystallin family protein [Acholeplasmataceae bacterium]